MLTCAASEDRQRIVWIHVSWFAPNRRVLAERLLERDGHRYAYRLTDKGIRVALMFILFHQRVCGPLANSLFHRTPTQLHTPASKLQAACQKADASIQQVIDLLAA